MSLLLVDDGLMIGKSVFDRLRAESYAVDWVKDGDVADTALATHTHDLVLPAVGLSRRDALGMSCSVRARKESIPVLIATARDSVQQRIEGLGVGSDDYVLNPYDLDGHFARVAGSDAPGTVVGSGLCLAVVSSIIELHGAAPTLGRSKRLSGLKVTVG